MFKKVCESYRGIGRVCEFAKLSNDEFAINSGEAASTEIITMLSCVSISERAVANSNTVLRCVTFIASSWVWRVGFEFDSWCAESFPVVIFRCVLLLRGKV